MATLLDTYADLQTALATWLFRVGDTDLAARAPDLIQLFEAEFTTDPEMRTYEMEEIDTATITSAAIALPSGFLQMRRLRVLATSSLPGATLEYVTPEVAGIMDDNADVNSSGTVENYTIIAEQIFLEPQIWFPNNATIEMVYYAFSPLAGGAGSGTNWLLQKYPNLYLYGSLMQAAAYIDDKETVAFWQAAYEQAKSKLATSDKKRKSSGSPLRMGASTSFIGGGRNVKAN